MIQSFNSFIIHSNQIIVIQYQKEIERLQANVQILNLKLEQAEQQLESEPGSPEIIDNEPDNMKNIIARYVT